MAAKIEDVARQAGVSIATVSRVLANKPHVSAKTRQQVLDAVDALGYRPSRAARSLRSKQTKTLGLIISDIQNPFFIAIVRAVEDVAYQYDYTVVLCNSDEDPAKEALYVELMVAENMAGVIISPTAKAGVACRQLFEAAIPVVAVDRKLTGLPVDSVIVDNAAASYQVITHLIEAGHTRIGAILGTPDVSTGSERQQGYLNALTEHGLPVVAELLRCGVPKTETGYQLTNELLALPDPPTALFTGNNLLTVGALRAIHERGLRMPDDVALVAFDEMEWMFVMNPPLTVVAQPTYAMGQKAAELLLARIQDSARPIEEITMMATVDYRGSSLAPRLAASHAV
ncbi:MAG: LacI family DNA-binding transcriptional regulator [Caldilineaceae bacterium]